MAGPGLVVPPSLFKERFHWRPTELPEDAVEACLSQVLQVPFAPSIRVDKTARACDFTFWTAQKHLNAQREGRVAPAAPVQGEPTDFTLVDSSRIVKAKSRFQKGRARQTVAQQQAQRQAQQQQQRQLQQQRQQQQRFQQRQNFARGGKKDKLGAAYQQNRNQQQNNRWSNIRARAVAAECAVEINPEWKIVTDLPLANLSPYTVVPKDIEIQDLEWRGKSSVYNQTYDRLNPRTPKDLAMEHAAKYSTVVPQAQTDVVLANLLEEDETIDVIVTDQALSALLAAPQSRYAWQVRCWRIEGRVIIDKTEGSTLDLLSVNETSPDPPPMEMGTKVRSVYEVGVEAAKTNLAFHQMVVDSGSAFEEHGPLPFVENNETAPGKAYRYRSVKLPPGKSAGTAGAQSRRGKPITVAVRAEVDGVVVDSSGEAEAYVAVHALNEGPSTRPGTLSWSSALVNQKGALLATELRNNACKMTRWIYSAMMAGCSQLKLGWITKRNEKFSLLAVQSHRVGDLAAQMGLKPGNAWGIVREVLDIVLSDNTEDGQYIITRDALQPQLKIHYTPLEADNTAVVEGEE